MKSMLYFLVAAAATVTCIARCSERPDAEQKASHANDAQERWHEIALYRLAFPIVHQFNIRITEHATIGDLKQSFAQQFNYPVGRQAIGILQPLRILPCISVLIPYPVPVPLQDDDNVLHAMELHNSKRFHLAVHRPRTDAEDAQPS